MTDFALRRRMMVDTQVRPSDVTEFPIIDAMLSVPREEFVPSDKVEAAYVSEHIALENGRVILDPRCLAKMLECANLTNRDLVLDIGGGLGYSSAIAAHIAEAVVMVEDNAERVSEAISTLAAQGAETVIVHEGPLDQGAAEHGPYDAILIQGGVEVLPQAISDQLKDGGRIVCLFMENALGVVRVGYKSNGTIAWRFGFNAGAPVLPGFEKTVDFAL